MRIVALATYASPLSAMDVGLGADGTRAPNRVGECLVRGLEGFDGSRAEVQLRSLLEDVGRAAQAAGRPLAILIDELPFLHLRDEGREFGALIAALHRVDQRTLPIIMFVAITDRALSRIVELTL